MLDEPRIRTEIEGMQATISRIIWQIKKSWKFELELREQIAYIALWRFLEEVQADDRDPVEILRAMKRNALTRVNRRFFWRLVTRECRDCYAEENFFIDANPARGTRKRRRIPKCQHLKESLLASDGDIPFDPMPYLPEIIARLSPEDQDVVNLLMYEEMTVKEFMKRENLDSRKWYERRDAVKSRFAHEIRRVERALFTARQVNENVEELLSDEMISDAGSDPKG